jgi:hypothetical protein
MVRNWSSHLVLLLLLIDRALRRSNRVPFSRNPTFYFLERLFYMGWGVVSTNRNRGI